MDHGSILSFIRDHLCSSFFTMLPHANRKSEQWRNNFRIFISLYFTLRQVKKYDVISPSSDTLIRSWGVGWEACWAWLCFVNGLKQQWWWREFPSSLILTTNSHLPQDTQMLWYLQYNKQDFREHELRYLLYLFTATNMVDNLGTKYLKLIGLI